MYVQINYKSSCTHFHKTVSLCSVRYLKQMSLQNRWASEKLMRCTDSLRESATWKLDILPAAENKRNNYKIYILTIKNYLPYNVILINICILYVYIDDFSKWQTKLIYHSWGGIYKWHLCVWIAHTIRPWKVIELVLSLNTKNHCEHFISHTW